MSLKQLLAAKRIAREPTSKQEIDELRSMAQVNLNDAKVGAVSAQGRYEFAYNAGRLSATVVVRATGHRVIAKNGHHYYTFQALAAADDSFKITAAYFDSARDKRNNFSYSSLASISDSDAQDLVDAADQLAIEIEQWIVRKFPALRK